MWTSWKQGMNGLDLNSLNQVPCFFGFNLSRLIQKKHRADSSMTKPESCLSKSHPMLTGSSMREKVTPARFLPTSTQIMQGQRQDFSSQQSRLSHISLNMQTQAKLHLFRTSAIPQHWELDTSAISKAISTSLKITVSSPLLKCNCNNVKIFFHIMHYCRHSINT